MNHLSAQRALEALRNGVPNADAVRMLRCMQPEVLDRFEAQLDALAASPNAMDPPVVPGMVISAGFGVGKSHTLSSLEQQALARNFVVSRLVISKETPLQSPAKIFHAALRDARLSDTRGSLLHELAMRVDYASPAGQQFVQWVLQRQPHGILAASVVIHERSNNAELIAQVVNWWSGEKLFVNTVRDAIRELGIPNHEFKVQAVAEATLAPVRFEFASRLARAAGYAGWVLMLDEVELVARYSLLQRARAYAELARWLGAKPEWGVRGITTVAAISEDFYIAVLDERNDREKAPDRLSQQRGERSQQQVEMAQIGIELIGPRNAFSLSVPSDDTLTATYERLRQLYEEAYGYRPGDRKSLNGSPHRPMRVYIRRWISDWDLDRLYGEDRAHAQEEDVRKINYSESPELSEEFDAQEDTICGQAAAPGVTG